MSVFVRSIMMIGLVFLLAGCGSADNEETKEPVNAEKAITLDEQEIDELFVDFNTAADEVDVYDVDMQLVIEMTEDDDETIQKAQTFGTLEESMANLEMTAIEVQGVNKNEVHLYKAGKDIYLKENGADWVKTKEETNEYSQSDTSYENVAHALDSIHNLLEVVETNETYELKYSGQGNPEIFNAFEKPFNLNLTGVEIEETTMNAKFIVDKESKHIEDIQFEITAEQDGVELLLTVNVDYAKINTATVGIPVEVIEEATK